MTAWQLLTESWSFKPLVLAGCTALILGYAALIRLRFTGKTLYFISGVLLLFLSLVSPLNALAHGFLFSAHMLQHIFLLLIVPLLFLLGIPSSLAEKLLLRPRAAAVESVLRGPVIAWLSGVGAMWVWHVPVLYDAALKSESLHVIQQLSLLVAGVIFWWPIFSPFEGSRLNPLVSVLYLFSACVGCTVLGIVITFAPAGLFATSHLHVVDTQGIIGLVRDDWGISRSVDQQVGGLLMWVPCCLLYSSIIMSILARWYKAPEESVVSTLTADGMSPVAISSAGKVEI
ncbi:MAG TPA: cytochrome c oxidase assembly protein [Thermodesulfobacteriota bacterium]|nr:cytochrome c oxidase assembly protein [Thermodesulfobacteriota bacterium]